MLIKSTFETPIGWLEVKYDEHYIYNAAFTAQYDSPLIDNAVSRLIKNELIAYFQNHNHRFKLALKPQGSFFQQRVWNALLTIPAGRTVTYGDLANTLQSSPRAIGQACKSNPITLFIPCHRVIGKASLGGYMGKAKALNYKTGLLQHEGYNRT